MSVYTTRGICPVDLVCGSNSLFAWGVGKGCWSKIARVQLFLLVIREIQAVTPEEEHFSLSLRYANTLSWLVLLVV